MQKKKGGASKSGIKAAIIGFIALVLAVSIYVAALRSGEVNSLGDLWPYFLKKSGQVASLVKKTLNSDFSEIRLPSGDTDNTDPTDHTDPTDPNDDYNNGDDSNKDTGGRGRISGIELKPVSEITDIILPGIKISEPESVDYDRSEWKHWSSPKGRSCWNTRKQVLARDGEDIIYLDSKKNEIDSVDKACYVVQGVWVDPFSGTIFENPSDLDIDHIVPLSYAARHGGQDWDSDKKEEFANDMTGLLAVSASENRKKGDKGPEDYMPFNRGSHCDYSKAFIQVINKYNLTITQGDKEALTKGLTTCVD